MLPDGQQASAGLLQRSAAQGGLVLTGREEHLTRCGRRAEGGRRISYEAADNISATKRPTQQMFSKDPTRSRASLLQHDGHEAASSFHRHRHRGQLSHSDPLEPTLHSQLSPPHQGLSPLSMSTTSPRRLEGWTKHQIEAQSARPESPAHLRSGRNPSRTIS
jgi:hypothetical protein